MGVDDRQQESHKCSLFQFIHQAVVVSGRGRCDNAHTPEVPAIDPPHPARCIVGAQESRRQALSADTTDKVLE